MYFTTCKHLPYNNSMWCTILLPLIFKILCIRFLTPLNRKGETTVESAISRQLLSGDVRNSAGWTLKIITWFGWRKQNRSNKMVSLGDILWSYICNLKQLVSRNIFSETIRWRLPQLCPSIWGTCYFDSSKPQTSGGVCPAVFVGLMTPWLSVYQGFMFFCFWSGSIYCHFIRPRYSPLSFARLFYPG